MQTYNAQSEKIDRKWYVVDASEYELGRLATRLVTVLRGKHKPIFTPHVDTGDFVVVLNASKVKLTGRKLTQKHYHRYSGYPGGMTSIDAQTVLATDPERVIRQAVKGMLPKNRMSRQVIKKLKIYGGADHPHAAQKPSPFPNV